MGAKKKAAKKAAKKATKKPAKRKATKRKRKPSKRGMTAELEARVAAAPSETAERNPNEPVAQFCSLCWRTEELMAEAEKGIEALPGFQSWWKDAGVLARELADADAKWSAIRSKTRAGVTPAKVREAEALKSDIMDCGRYLLRHNAEVQEELDQITIGSGIADLALDLHKLQGLVIRYPGEFGASLDDGAAVRAGQLYEELMKGVEPGEGAEVQARRNRLFWVAREACSELRASLRFWWRAKPNQLARLGVGYNTRLLKQRRAKEKAPTT